MKFNSKIIDPVLLGKNKSFTTQPYTFTFTRHLVIFPGDLLKKYKNAPYPISEHCLLHDRASYTFVQKIPKHHPERIKNSRFQISFDKACRVNLVMNEWNTFKFKWMQRMYFIQKNAEKALIFILGGIVSLLLYLLGQYILRNTKHENNEVPEQQSTPSKTPINSTRNNSDSTINSGYSLKKKT